MPCRLQPNIPDNHLFPAEHRGVGKRQKGGRMTAPINAIGWSEPRLMTLFNTLDELYHEWRDPEGGTDTLSDKFKRARDLCEEADVMIENIHKGGFA